MGKLKRKHTEGASKTYITRNRALKKLQLPLSDFRRLCILKGIYPVEPKNRKRANRGSTKPTTFYYTKDVQLLLSEPLIAKFREHKIFLRRLQHALGKRDTTHAKSIEAHRPQYTLDHLVRERYPTFTDALRDLDDSLCMIFLFATMPVVQRVNVKVIEDCKKLSSEFMHYIIHTHSLRKVFLSIKGIYYQAEISGHTITWIVPYQFSQRVPADVDFRVMATFLEFYRTLLGFVNYRLYTGSNLVYPPKLDSSLDESAAGLGSLRLEASGLKDLIEASESGSVLDKEATPAMSKEMKQRLNTLEDKIKTLSKSEESAPEYNSVATSPGHDDDSDNDIESFLFNKQVFFLSREVPRYSLEFVIRAFGGRLGWDSSSGGGSPYAENDQSITIQIADRPIQGHQFLNRMYVQPQWVYDSINMRRLLDPEEYLVGQTLPPHLSPFVEYNEGDYVPESAAKAVSAEGFVGEVTNLKPEDRDQPVSDNDNNEIEGESADENEPDSDTDDLDTETKAEYMHQKHLEAESAGVSFSEYEQKKNSSGSKSTSNRSKRSASKRDEEELENLAVSMLSKKKRKMVNRARAEAKKREKDINTLKSRKAGINNIKSKNRK